MSALQSFLTSRSLIALVSRFSSVGLLATLVYFLLANIGIMTTQADPAVVSVFAYIGGMFVSYYGQSRVTFQTGNENFGQVIRFATLSLAGLAVSYFAVRFTVDTLSLPALYGTLTVCAIVPIFSFLLMKIWVFRPAPLDSQD